MRSEDIELGDEAVEVERKPRAGVVVSIHLSADEADKLQRLDEQRETTLSHMVQEAMSTYLANDTRRAPVDES